MNTVSAKATNDFGADWYMKFFVINLRLAGGSHDPEFRQRCLERARTFLTMAKKAEARNLARV